MIRSQTICFIHIMIIIAVANSNRFHVSLLVISSILLMVTIGIYTYYKQLLTEYTRIMRHFASVLLVTYIILVINKSTHLGDSVSHGVCLVSGKL